jgi:hypothetical protein
MLITQTPKLFLSLLLCLPVVVSAAPKSVSSDPAGTSKVQPVKQTKRPVTAGQYPKRGMTMQQVRKQYGEPNSVRRSAGKVKKQWPRITVWNYGKFSVYFERRITLHTVIH